MAGAKHQQIPDLDNCLKALLDASKIGGSRRKDDRRVWHLSGLKKVWGYEGYIEIK